jgi:sugar/nucleoside kinase (ribokinase family)
VRVPFVLLGDVMVDITAIVSQPMNHASDTPAHITLQAGGSAANTARWLAHDHQVVTLIAAVGVDDFGALVEASLTADGVLPALQRIPGTGTGACIVLVDAAGERTMLPDSGANSALQDSLIVQALFQSDGHFHLSGYTLLNPNTREAGLRTLARAQAAGMTTSLDPASAAPLARDPTALDAALSLVDLLLANEAEAAVLTRLSDPTQGLAALAARVATVVIKRGPLGAIAQRGLETASVEAVPAAVIDTTGAGDAFAAGFLVPWTSGLPLARALALAAASASRAISRVGAGPRSE